MTQQKKQTIKQIKNMIEKNIISKIISIDKISGSNIWTVNTGFNNEHHINNVETMKNLGFKIIHENQRTGRILAEYQEVNNTHYGRQVKVFA